MKKRLSSQQTESNVLIIDENKTIKISNTFFQKDFNYSLCFFYFFKQSESKVLSNFQAFVMFVRLSSILLH